MKEGGKILSENNHSYNINEKSLPVNLTYRLIINNM